MIPRPPQQLIRPLAEKHRDYLRDESGIIGRAQSISFPELEAEVQAIVKLLSRQQVPIKVQGSRTSMSGAAVPAGGHILNLSRMTRVTGLAIDRGGRFLPRVQPGLTLAELDRQLAGGRFDCGEWDPPSLQALQTLKKARRQFWPPDPSERSASVGGVIANNSRGIRVRRYGLAGEHISAIRVVAANGEAYAVSRGDYVFNHGACRLPDGGTLTLGPAGAAAATVTDLLDLYAGSQGLYGAITEMTLVLQPEPKEQWGIVFFFAAQDRAAEFIQMIGEGPRFKAAADLAAIDLLDHTTLNGIRDLQKIESRLEALPDWDPGTTAAVYVEILSDEEQAVEAVAEWLLETAVAYDNDPYTSWAFCGEQEMERLRMFRHAAPEAVNALTAKGMRRDAGLTRLAIDLHFAKGGLREGLVGCQQELAARGLRSAIFGHAAEGPLHLHIFPQNACQVKAGCRLIASWERPGTIPGAGIAVPAERVSTEAVRFSPGVASGRWNMISKVKAQLDPNGTWGPGMVVRTGKMKCETDDK